MREQSYHVYICYGRGARRRESLACTAYGRGYVDAATRFAESWNRWGQTVYGTEWRKVGRQKGMPPRHCYVKDEQGKKLLLLPTP